MKKKLYAIAYPVAFFTSKKEAKEYLKINPERTRKVSITINGRRVANFGTLESVELV